MDERIKVAFSNIAMIIENKVLLSGKEHIQLQQDLEVIKTALLKIIDSQNKETDVKNDTEHKKTVS